MLMRRKGCCAHVSAKADQLTFLGSFSVICPSSKTCQELIRRARGSDVVFGLFSRRRCAASLEIDSHRAVLRMEPVEPPAARTTEPIPQVEPDRRELELAERSAMMPSCRSIATRRDRLLMSSDKTVLCAEPNAPTQNSNEGGAHTCSHNGPPYAWVNIVFNQRKDEHGQA